MASIDLFVLWRLRQKPSARLYLRLFGLVWLVLVSLALILTLIVGDDPWFGSMFMAIGALAQGIFVHGVLLLLLSGLLLRLASPWLARASAGLGVLTLGVGVYAFWIEPTLLEINHLRIESFKLGQAQRLVVISDLQMESLGSHEKRALRAALAQEPDVLLLPGDFIHARAGKPYQDLVGELNAFLKQVNFGARLGVIAVAGNVEREGWPEIFAGLDVHSFEDSDSLALGGVHFSAIDFSDSGRRDLLVPDRPGFHVALGHRPDFALGEIHADLLVAGHTHGGQVVLPFIGPPITLTAVPRSWASGRTKLTDGRTLVVSRGVGMERGYAPRLRFGCPPEILVIDLVPSPRERVR